VPLARRQARRRASPVGRGPITWRDILKSIKAAGALHAEFIVQ
jgi:hypothetical protein